MLNFAQAATMAWNPTLEPLDEKLSEYIGGNPVRLDGKPRASGILDTVRAARAHGISIPAELRDKAIMDPLEKAVVEEWFSGYKTEELRGMTKTLQKSLSTAPMIPQSLGYLEP